jgi:transcriptional regulator with XRE-family HTH domain
MAKRPNSVDEFVGARLRLRRKQLGLTQEQLGARLGLTFQQIQKYEKGINRIGAGRLPNLAGILQVPISYFFPGSASDIQPDAVALLLATPGATDLLTANARIEELQSRSALVGVAQALAGATSARTNRPRPKP